MLDYLKKGQCFGEMTALNKTESPFTVEVCSETATILKIHINDFLWLFGGEDGAPVMCLRSQIIMKNNWLRMKKQFLSYMSKVKLMSLEYRDDAKYGRLQPTSKQIREVPFMQNNPETQKQVRATSISSAEEAKRRERQDKIDVLKKSLM